MCEYIINLQNTSGLIETKKYNLEAFYSLEAFSQMNTLIFDMQLQ